MIVNPAAGRAALRRQLPTAIEALRFAGWTVETRRMSAPGDGQILARSAAAEDRDVVVAAGGDGTVNEVANALVGTRTALAVLPMGTGNVWATELGITSTRAGRRNAGLVRAAQALTRAKTRQVDVGCARYNYQAGGSSTRYFALWAGVGLDATLTQYVEGGPAAGLKRQLGNLAYLGAALVAARRQIGGSIELELDGRRLQTSAFMVHIANVGLYAGGLLRLVRNVRLDDGYMDVCIFKGQGVRQCLRLLTQVVRGRHLEDPDVESCRVRRVTLSGDVLPIQLDGDYVGCSPAEFTIVPGALRALVA